MIKQSEPVQGPDGASLPLCSRRLHDLLSDIAKSHTLLAPMKTVWIILPYHGLRTSLIIGVIVSIINIIIKLFTVQSKDIMAEKSIIDGAITEIIGRIPF